MDDQRRINEPVSTVLFIGGQIEFKEVARVWLEGATWATDFKNLNHNRGTAEAEGPGLRVRLVLVRQPYQLHGIARGTMAIKTPSGPLDAIHAANGRQVQWIEPDELP